MVEILTKQNHPTIYNGHCISRFYLKGGVNLWKNLSYSLHLGNDKNKSKKARRTAKLMTLTLLHSIIMQFKTNSNYQKWINIIYKNMMMTKS